MHLNDLYERYLTFEASEDLFKETEKLLKIPVNLNIYRTTGNIFRRNYSEFYRYLDEYSFKDRSFIYDAKSKFVDNYRSSQHWLKDLKRKNIQDYIGHNKFYKPEHGVTYDKHVDWIDNKEGIKLLDLLHLDTSRNKLFTEENKHISLKHDFLHGSKIRDHAFYFKRGSSLEDYYSRIEYGKLKHRPRDFKNMFAFEVYENDCANARKSYVDNTYRFSELEEGFEGTCGVEIHIDPYKEIFVSSESKKWSTSYAAYKFFDLVDQGRQEYYYYLLGGFEDKHGLGKNLVSSLNSEGGIWYVDYDNIFVAKLEGQNLSFSLNKDKLPENIDGFLKVSTLFDFEFSFNENGDSKKVSFDLKQLLSGNAKIPLSSSSALFSDVSVSLMIKTSKKETPIEMISSSNKFTYSVDASNLDSQGLIFDQIFFDERGTSGYFPSQLLSDEILAKHFYFSSEKNRKHVFSVSDLKKLNIYREFNDEEGTIRIFYYDYKDGRNKEAYLGDLRKIPRKDYAAVEVNDLSEAISELRKKLDLPDYFWDSIEFFEPKSRRLFDETAEYAVRSKSADPNMRLQWQFPSIKVFVKNSENLSLLTTKTHASSKDSFEDLFLVSEHGLRKGLSLSDYRFFRYTEGDTVRFEVSLNKFGKTDRKEYSFHLVKENISGSRLSSWDSDNDDFFQEENSSFLESKNFLWGTAGAFFGGALALCSLKLYPFFKRGTF